MSKIKITYENLTPALRVANKRRIIGTVIGWFIFIIAFFVGFYYLSQTKDASNDIRIAIIPSVLLGWIAGGVVTGFFHIEYTRFNISLLLWIPFIGWTIWFFIIIFCGTYIGMASIITNIFRLLFRKPLISLNEIGKLECVYSKYNT